MQLFAIKVKTLAFLFPLKGNASGARRGSFLDVKEKWAN
jgi:hypothetical protein